MNRELINANKTGAKNTASKMAVAVGCGLALFVSTLASDAWARGGSGGGRSMGGMNRYSGPTNNNFVRTTPINTQNFNSLKNGNNFTKVNSFKNFSKPTNLKTNFNKLPFQKLSKLSKKGMKGPFWKKYWGWGFGWWGGDFGWGWNSWDSPWCYGWCEYEPVPVAAYYNPYCECAGTVVDGTDYSMPISSLSTSTDGDSSDLFATARAAFAEGDMDAALKAISAAALQSPRDQDVHQFHSLVLFARRSYCKSATVAHAVLEAGPGWTWDTLQSFYPSPAAYTEELRQLEHYVGEHPSDANVRFLLGYHYLMLNHANVAQRQFAQVAELEPKDKLAANILTGMKTNATAKVAKKETAPMQVVPTRVKQTIDDPADDEEDSTDDDATPASTPAATVKVTPTSSQAASTDATPASTQVAEAVTATPPSPPVAAATVTPSSTPVTATELTPMIGTFKASPAKGVQIELTLRKDKTFTWNFTANGKAKSFSGKYTLADNSLVLRREDGESMDGTLETAGNGFKFRMKDADSDDPGLSFSR